VTLTFDLSSYGPKVTAATRYRKVITTLHNIQLATLRLFDLIIVFENSLNKNRGYFDVYADRYIYFAIINCIELH